MDVVKEGHRSREGKCCVIGAPYLGRVIREITRQNRRRSLVGDQVRVAAEPRTQPGYIQAETRLLAHQNATDGTMSHCASGAKPDPNGGTRGIHSEYDQLPRTSTFTHSLKIV